MPLAPALPPEPALPPAPPSPELDSLQPLRISTSANENAATFFIAITYHAESMTSSAERARRLWTYPVSVDTRLGLLSDGLEGREAQSLLAHRDNDERRIPRC